jgi:hypothetical protein
MAAKKTPKKQSKSDFVRAQPATLSAAQVLAKAKAAGLKITPQLVYKVRGRSKAKDTKKKAPAVKTTAISAKPTASTKPPKSKAAFVRGLPSSTPAQDVVKHAKALGLSLSINYVYNIRGAAKMAAKKRAAVKSPVVRTVANGGSWSVSQHAETLLRAIAAEIGLGHAIELLHAERARVHSILR